MEVLSRNYACLLVLSAAAACTPQGGGVSSAEGQPQSFASSDEAVRKAKSDFLEVLRSDRGPNLGVDAATLERAQAGAPVRRVDLDFGKLLSADSTATFDALVSEERNTVVPFLADNNVVSIVEIVRSTEGWRVVGLAGRDIAEALNVVHGVVGDSVGQRTSLYEVPNLQTRVYGVKRGEAEELLFSDYSGRFTLRQGVRASVLIAALKAGAIEFQRQYGDSLRRRPLLR